MIMLNSGARWRRRQWRTTSILCTTSFRAPAAAVRCRLQVRWVIESAIVNIKATWHRRSTGLQRILTHRDTDRPLPVYVLWCTVIKRYCLLHKLHNNNLTVPEIMIMVATRRKFEKMMTLEMLHWPASHHSSSTVSRQSWMQRLVFQSSWYYHITPLLQRLHWLRAPERISYKLAVLVFQCTHGLLGRSTWLMPYIQLPEFQIDNACGHRRSRHWLYRWHGLLLSATAHFLSLWHEHGTVCQLKWRRQIPSKLSRLN